MATTRLWHETPLAQELKVDGADADELYDALDWLLDRQSRIEKKLARRHLEEGAKVLYDVSSSSYHGRHCILATYGYNRDGEKLPSVISQIKLTKPLHVELDKLENYFDVKKTRPNWTG